MDRPRRRRLAARRAVERQLGGGLLAPARNILCCRSLPTPGTAFVSLMENARIHLSHSGGPACLAAPAEAVVLGTASRDANGVRRAVVAVENSVGELCSGALIAQDLVLTAAHCVDRTRPSYRIVSVNRAFRTQAVNVARGLGPSGFRARNDAAHATRRRSRHPETRTAARRRIRPLRSAPARRPSRMNDRGHHRGFRAALRKRQNRSARTLREAPLVSVGTVEVANPCRSRSIAAGAPRRRAPAPAAGDSGGPVFTGAACRIIACRASSAGRAARCGPPCRALCGGMTAITPLADHLGWVTDATRRLGRPRRRVDEPITAHAPRSFRRRSSTA